jgi:hypothetical protein
LVSKLWQIFILSIAALVTSLFPHVHLNVICMGLCLAPFACSWAERLHFPKSKFITKNKGQKPMMHESNVKPIFRRE